MTEPQPLADQLETWFGGSQRESLAESIVERVYARTPGLAERFGEAGREHCVNDTLYHLSYLRSALRHDAPELFIEYLAWARALLAGLGLGADDLSGNLEVMREVFAETLPQPLASRTDALMAEGLDALPRLPDTLPTFIEPSRDHGELARAYLDALLDHRRRDACDLVLDAVDAGLPVESVYLDVVQPVQYELGRLWQLNQISVAQEHYCTATTMLVMSRLYGRFGEAPRVPHTILATTVANDLHEVGVRMLADLFELHGWHAVYLGSNTPTRDVVRTVERLDVDVIAIGATLTEHVSEVVELCARLRERCPEVVILVGGYPFRMVPSLWQRVGAHGSTHDAHDAVALASRLLDERRREATGAAT